MSLNPDQQAAVEHRGSPLLVLAGAGTGKTRVITHRVAALLEQDVPAWRILAVTFTNKAADEMRDRIARLCTERDDLNSLWVGTFHAISARILRQHGAAVGLTRNFTIYDAADQAAVMGRVLKEMEITDRMYTPAGVLSRIDRAKNRGLGPEQIGQLGFADAELQIVREAYTRYDQRLRAANAADFGDLLVLTVKLLREAKTDASGQLADLDPVAKLRTRFLHVVVDEYQDTNPVQAELVDLLASQAELCVVGDDDQAIYGWRGADVAQILGFSERHNGAKLVKLEQNYRSTTKILSCADAIISRNQGRLGKTLWSDIGEGAPVRLVTLADEREEARFVANEIAAAVGADASPTDFAIFYRTHAQSRVIEDEIRRAGLGVRIVGGVAFYERMEVKDVLSYMTLLINPQSDAHLLRVINRPARGIGNTTIQRLQKSARERDISLWKTLEDPAAAEVGRAGIKRVADFRTMILALTEEASSLKLHELGDLIISATGYREMLAAEATEEAASRLENLQELLGNMVEFVQDDPEATLEDYLELVSLVSGETVEGELGGAVTLMTVHSAKGLEFPNVYMTGLEERVFPHSRVLDDPVQLEEERRLAYVAVTRAKDNLTLTLANRRRLFGQTHVGVPSRFVRDLPRDSFAHVGSHSGSAYSSKHEPVPPRQTESWKTDIQYDQADDKVEGVQLFVGMQLSHPKFGEGELIGWSGDGDKLKLELKFPEHGTKTILARFCHPV